MAPLEKKLIAEETIAYVTKYGNNVTKTELPTT